MSDAAPYKTLERLARLGFAARAVVYLIIGGLAFLAAIGSGGGTTDARGALVTILRQPFGKVLLGLIAIGLLGFALWRLLMALRDPAHEGLFARIGYLGSAAANTAIAVAAGSLILPGVLPGADGGGTRGWTAELMTQPYGQWLVGLVGAVVIGVAIGFAVQAFRASFERHFDPRARTPFIRNLCRVGILARGVVLALIGIFLIVAAWQADPNEAKGLGEALASLRSQPYGQVLLGVVGAGLVAFAFFSGVCARYHRIEGT